MAVIDTDRPPEFPDWRVMDKRQRRTDLPERPRSHSAWADLRRIRETGLADRVAAAIKTAKRQMRPKAQAG
jgi:hypothetical protein